MIFDLRKPFYKHKLNPPGHFLVIFTFLFFLFLFLNLVSPAVNDCGLHYFFEVYIAVSEHAYLEIRNRLVYSIKIPYHYRNRMRTIPFPWHFIVAEAHLSNILD